MHITGWHIDGFGVFNDMRVDDLDQRPVIVLGRNEAGKSTLLAFLQGVLFDFPRSRNARKFKPLKGGNHGGRVFLQTDRGPVTIDRQANGKKAGAIVTAADGVLPSGAVRGDEETLRTLLGHADGGVFRSVFAFSLTELQDLETLNAEGIRDQLFSAGIAGAGRSATSARNDIDRRSGEILRPRSGPLYDLHATIQQLERRLTTARDELTAHGPLLEDEERATVHADEARQRAEEALAALRRAETLKRLWPVQAGIIEAETELEAGSDAPTDLLAYEEEIRNLIAGADNHRQNIAQWRVREQSLAAAVQSLAPDPAMDRMQTVIAGAVGERQAIRERLLQRDDLTSDLDDQTREMQELLARLGPDWTAQQAVAARPTLATRDAIQAARIRRDECSQASVRTEEAVAGARNAIVDIQTELASANETADSLPDAPTPDAINAQARRLREARQALKVLDARRQDIRHEQSALVQAERDLTRAGPPVSTIARRAPWIGAAVLIAVASGFVLTSGVLDGATPTQTPLAIVAGLALIALAVLIVRIPSIQRGHGLLDGEVLSAQTAFDQACAAHDDAVDAARRAEEDARTALNEAGLQTGCLLHGAPDPIPDGEDALDRARMARQALDRATERVTEAQQRLQREEPRLSQKLKDLEEAENDVAQANRQWGRLLTSIGLPSSISGDNVTEALALIDRAAERATAIAGHKDRLAALTAGLEDWRRTIAELAESTGVSPVPQTVGAALATAEDLADRLEAHDLQAARRVTQQESLDRVIQDIREAEALEKAALDRLSALAKDAGAPNQDGLLSALENARIRAGLRRKIRESETQLSEQIGSDDDARSIRDELRTGRLDDWSETIRTMQEIEAGARQEERDARTLAVQAATRRFDLEKSADVPAIETELSGLYEAFDEGLEEWRILSLSSSLIRETLTEFQRSRQPAVLGSATSHFQTVTKGRYTRIAQDPEVVGGIRVETLNGQTLEPTDLSRGTAEQLYMALRLGLVDDYGGRHARLPIIVDDVLVNFDPGRASAMAEAFLSVASHHQVMVFTCHPWIVETFRALDPSVRVLELSDPATS